MQSHYPRNDAEYDERVVLQPETKLPPMKRHITSYQWAVGVLFTLILGLGGWGLMNIATLQARAAAADVKIENTHNDLERVDGRLIRIEDKLDRIIEQGVRVRTEPSAPRSRALAPEPSPQPRVRNPQGA